MRTLKYAILGLLNQKNLSGYDLASEFGGALQEFWTANHSQIYPELKRLTEEGLVEYQVEISGNVLERKVYSITDAGRKDFHAWLKREEDMTATPKDVFRLRMFFSNEMEAADRLRITEHELRQHRARLEHLRLKQQSFSGIPDSSDPAFGDCLVLMGAVMREEASCAWLERCIEIMSGNRRSDG